ncbi:hypothetical protein GGQ54_002795 [Naumannella cuiyingiana]|uniref:CAAX prenyl protease 2/Lysostaphin resistance protein A-like domain-containing protein n=1 Tax=Naumannella cuiyingiana TaxID=1347891 RepID=A0A7Z0DAX0_9ACTN|nr:type II CAAX endopeptidase family protein [Naumannella cuiyingiana]NYI72235.1 hypothetical protein [Naumannella cuiyingiana]
MGTSQQQSLDQLPFPEAMRAARRPTGPILGIVVVSVIFLLAQASALPFVSLDDQGTQMTFAKQAILTGSFAVGAILIFAWVRWKEGRRISTLGFARPGAMMKIGRGALIGIAMISVVALVNAALGSASIGSPDWSAVGPAAVLLLGFGVQGSTEELYARGYLVQAVAWKWGVIAAFAIQTIWFTLLHGANGGMTLVPVINLALVALFLGCWSLAEGGLWGVCAFHALWNWGQGNLWGANVSNMEISTSVLSFDPAPGASELLTGGGFGFEGSIVATIVLAIGTVVAFTIWQRNRRRDAGAEAELGR